MAAMRALVCLASAAAVAASAVHGHGALMRAERSGGDPSGQAPADLAVTADTCRVKPSQCRCAHRRRDPVLTKDAPEEDGTARRRRCLDKMGRTNCKEKTNDRCVAEVSRSGLLEEDDLESEDAPPSSLIEEESEDEDTEGESEEHAEGEEDSEAEHTEGEEGDEGDERGPLDRSIVRKRIDHGSMRAAEVALRRQRIGSPHYKVVGSGDLKCKNSFFQNLWTRRCQWCPGTTRRRRAYSCDHCIMGFYKAKNTYLEKCTNCEGGTVRRRRALHCTPCKPHYFNPNDSEDCVKCPIGSVTERRRRNAGECVDMRSFMEEKEVVDDPAVAEDQ